MGRPESVELAAIGARIEERLTALGMTQTQLAIRAELSQPQVSKYIAGKAAASADALKRIARVLGCSFAWLRTGQEEPMPPVSVPVSVSSGRQSLSLEDFLASHGDDVTQRERRMLEKARSRMPALHAGGTVDDWRELVELIREEFQPLGRGGGTGGGEPSKT